MTPIISLTIFVLAQAPDAPRFREAPRGGYEVIARLPSEWDAQTAKGAVSQENGQKILRVSLVSDNTKSAGPAMLGTYERIADELVFHPRFPLSAGLTYRAELSRDGNTVTTEFLAPAPRAKAPPKVTKIYPTTDVLPANVLKFYIYFDRPMRGGNEIFKQITLVDDKGKEIADSWLIDEIWDEENNCLIIYIHPGRIKWGVDERELFGPVLLEKREYSLVIRGTWTDLEGNKIGKDVVKKFRTIAEDRVRVELSAWKLTAPKAGSREPLTLSLPKAFDHRSLQRFVSVYDEKDQRVAGTISFGKDEKSCQFTPAQPWQKQDYQLHVADELEDVAGNTPRRPFDVDLDAPKLPRQNPRFDFRPR